MHQNTSLYPLLKKIIQSPYLHAKWLNTLSYLENCGAKKIARCQHPIKVRQEILKHASEEFRHAYFLKKQIAKTGYQMEEYHTDTLLGGSSTLTYLDKLDIRVCRFLQKQGITSKRQKQEYAYLLVTYTIEVRARSLYPLYESLLREASLPIRVQSIVLEEIEHLREMEEQLSHLPLGKEWVPSVLFLEEHLFSEWSSCIQRQLSNPHLPMKN